MSKTAAPAIRIVPRLATDEDAEAFLAQDLSSLDFSQFKLLRLRFEKEAEANGASRPAAKPR